MFPETKTTEPYSPIPREKAREKPVISAGKSVGKMTCRKACQRVPPSEAVEAEREDEAALPEPHAASRPLPTGARGRVIRAYLRFLGGVAGRRLRRRADQTPLEIAAELREPQTPLGTLTSLFMSARWGPREPSDADARAAEAACASVLAASRRSR